MRQYDIRSANLPQPIGRRPVLLLTRIPAYQYLSKVIVAEITTIVRGIPQEVPMGRREGLERASVANLDNVDVAPTARLGHLLGTLGSARHPEVKRQSGRDGPPERLARARAVCLSPPAHQRQRRRPARRDRHGVPGRRQPHEERLLAAQCHQQDRRHPLTSGEELHTLGALYESLLREMRDAAGDSGEFYTPRPVVRFMVAVTDPRLGETVLDPASGTGGFLVEAFRHLGAQVKTVADRKMLQERSLSGCEPKPLPYLLCQMNLLLHGLDAPQIDPGNALRHKLSEIGEKERADVILTNPPFGGEEEKGIQGNFPEDRQTAETALLFLQLIMRKLHRRAEYGAELLELLSDDLTRRFGRGSPGRTCSTCGSSIWRSRRSSFRRQRLPNLLPTFARQCLANLRPVSARRFRPDPRLHLGLPMSRP